MITAKRAWIRAFAKSFSADMFRRPNVAGNARELRGLILRDLTREVRGEPGPVLFPNLRAFLKTEMNIEEGKLSSGMGQWTELITSITDAASSYFTAREEGKTQARIAEIQARAKEAELRRQELEAQREREALAQEEGIPGGAAAAPAGGGIPTAAIVIPAVVVGGAVITKVAGVW